MARDKKGEGPHSKAPPNADRMMARHLSSPLPLSDGGTREHEDFLFHLYRGSELLQDNRVLEAKEELEYALTLQPRDSKGQDLLGAVYFRLGLYPRAIQIYENLGRLFPHDTSLKTNLALCYLKTGQPEAAKVELTEVVKTNPEHRRAWGYLGLVHDKLGDFEEAQVAFEQGGHPAMARRMAARRVKLTVPAPSAHPLGSGGELRAIAGMAFEELDAGDVDFALAEPGTGRSQVGTWHAIELGAIPHQQRVSEAPMPLRRTVTPPPPTAGAEPLTRIPPHGGRAVMPPGALSPPRTPMISAPPPALGQMASQAQVAFPDGQTVAVHRSGVVLVKVSGPDKKNEKAIERPFATRLEAIRTAKGVFATAIMNRRVREKESGEVLGGTTSPLVRVSGTVELVLGARAAHRLVPLELSDDLAFVREDLLLGFELSLAYENGRIAIDDGDPILIVQLRGAGSLVLELVDRFMAVDVAPDAPVLARREVIVGWLGRLLPRPLPLNESPSGQRGLVSFTGEGTVLIAAR